MISKGRFRKYFSNERNPEKPKHHCQKKTIFLLLILQILIVWIIYETSNKSYFISDPLNSFHKYLTMLTGNIFHLPLFEPKHMLPFYKDISQNVWCLKQGTNIESSQSQKKCFCMDNWQGFDCGMPPSVWDSDFIAKGKAEGVVLTRQERPRRIISLLVFNSNSDLLEIHIRELFDIVDVFVIAEENISSHNSLLPLQSQLQSGFLFDFQKKMIHVPILISVRKYVTSETLWLHVMYQDLLKELWTRVFDFRPDDILVISPIDSIPSRDILLFMKLYKGYPEPVNLYLRPSIFNFRLTTINSNDSASEFLPILCSFQYFSSLCNYNVLKLFRHACIQDKSSQQEFEKNFWRVKKWVAGSKTNPAGWNCKFCMSSKNIGEILVHHPWLIRNINRDLFQDLIKNRTVVIYNYMKAEKWFDNSTIVKEKLPLNSHFLAPRVLLENIGNFPELIGNYENNESLET